ncbi:MAG: hypothetical protein ACLU9S_04955 [Oscillospiraceae bacterium]
MIFQTLQLLNPTLKISTPDDGHPQKPVPGKRKTEYGQMMLDALDSVSMPAPRTGAGQLSGAAPAARQRASPWR